MTQKVTESVKKYYIKHNVVEITIQSEKMLTFMV